jgi:hypothetical protein
MMRAFIDDGYTRTVGIREVAGVMPAVEWVYRPLAGPEQSDAYTAILMAQDKQAAKLAFLLERLESWRFPDSEDAPGDFAKPEPAQLARLNASAFSKIEQCVMGTGSPDYEIVDASEVPGKSDAEQAGPDAKNSPGV